MDEDGDAEEREARMTRRRGTTIAETTAVSCQDGRPHRAELSYRPGCIFLPSHTLLGRMDGHDEG